MDSFYAMHDVLALSSLLPMSSSVMVMDPSPSCMFLFALHPPSNQLVSDLLTCSHSHETDSSTSMDEAFGCRTDREVDADAPVHCHCTLLDVFVYESLNTQHENSSNINSYCPHAPTSLVDIARGGGELDDSLEDIREERLSPIQQRTRRHDARDDVSAQTRVQNRQKQSKLPWTSPKRLWNAARNLIGRTTNILIPKQSPEEGVEDHEFDELDEILEKDATLKAEKAPKERWQEEEEWLEATASSPPPDEASLLKGWNRRSLRAWINKVSQSNVCYYYTCFLPLLTFSNEIQSHSSRASSSVQKQQEQSKQSEKYWNPFPSTASLICSAYTLQRMWFYRSSHCLGCKTLWNTMRKRTSQLLMRKMHLTTESTDNSWTS